jgi:ligand-binding sensor protein
MKTRALVLQNSTDIDWEGLERSLHDHFSVNAVTLEKNGDRRTSGAIVWANRLCALIKTSRKGSRRICEHLQQCLMHKVSASKKIACEECAAGMVEIFVPIIEIDEIDGFVGVCGRPYLDVERIYTAYIHQTIDVDQEKIKALLPTLKPIDPRTIRDIKQFITSYRS